MPGDDPFAGLPLYFGEPYPSREWPAPVYEGATKVATPVGEKCFRCLETIEEGDRGFYRGALVIHHECDIRGVIGSVKHQRGECGCATGDFSGDDDAGYPTRRDAARAALAEFELDGRDDEGRGLMGKIIGGREYNYAVVYEEDGEDKVASYATTSNEAETKLDVARGYFGDTVRDTCRIEKLDDE